MLQEQTKALASLLCQQLNKRSKRKRKRRKKQSRREEKRAARKRLRAASVPPAAKKRVAKTTPASTPPSVKKQVPKKTPLQLHVRKRVFEHNTGKKTHSPSNATIDQWKKKLRFLLLSLLFEKDLDGEFEDDFGSSSNGAHF